MATVLTATVRARSPFSVLWGLDPGEELLDHYGNVMFNISGTYMMFLQ